MVVYKYEMHCHDSLCSACAHSLPEEITAAYIGAGYSGLVFTNHFLAGNTAVNRRLPWKEKMEAYYDAYLRAKAYGDPRGFHVLFGLEHQYGGGKEVLTYGIGLDFLLENPEIHLLPLKEYSARVRAAGGYIAQAHPFREQPYIDPKAAPQPECLDAVEVYNFGNLPEENRRAAEFAQAHGLFGISGGDVHNTVTGVGMAGMAFDHEITTGGELVKALKNREGRLIVEGEIQKL